MVPAVLGSSVLRDGTFSEGERDEPVALPDEEVPRVESITYGELGALSQGQVDVVETLHQGAKKRLATMKSSGADKSIRHRL